MEKKVNGMDIISAVCVPNVTTPVEYHGIVFNVTEWIPFDKVLSFVNATAESCFTLDDEYVPQVDKFAFMSNVIDFYTDINLPDDLDERYKLVMLTDLYDAVIENVNERQIEELRDGVARLVEYKLSVNTCVVNKQIADATATLKALADTCGTFTETMNTDAMKEVVAALNNNTADRNALIAAYKATADTAKEKTSARSKKNKK